MDRVSSVEYAPFVRPLSLYVLGREGGPACRIGTALLRCSPPCERRRYQPLTTETDVIDGRGSTERLTQKLVAALTVVI